MNLIDCRIYPDEYCQLRNILFFITKLIFLFPFKGYLGDGYLVSALNLLSTKPEAVAQLFKNHIPNQFGVVCVTFCVNGLLEDVVIDDRIPFDENDHPLFIHSDGYWANLVEKAYAKLFKSYANIEVGSIGRTLNALFHSPTEAIDIDSTPLTTLWNKVCGYIETDAIVVAAVRDREEEEEEQEEDIRGRDEKEEEEDEEEQEEEMNDELPDKSSSKAKRCKQTKPSEGYFYELCNFVDCGPSKRVLMLRGDGNVVDRLSAEWTSGMIKQRDKVPKAKGVSLFFKNMSC